MTEAEEEAAGFRAAVESLWPPRRGGRGGSPVVAGASDRDAGAPEGSSEAFLRGWRQGIDRARH